MVNPVLKPLSPEEYLEWEQGQATRHEYVNGYVYAMSGVSRRHSRITMNIAVTLWPSATERGCRIHQAEVKLALDKIFYYPDVMVACGPEPENPYYETDPCILVEVLSPSTAQNDLREKVLEYKRIASLQTYLIVDPDSYFVRHFWRDPHGNWQQEDITGSGEIGLECLQTSLSLNQIYQGVF